MSRIPETFARLRAAKQTGLVAYLTTGFPDLASSPALVRAMVDGGADIIELGVPFSDPLADGATVQRASHQALLNGVTMADVLAVCRTLRDQGVTAPIVAMSYYNPVLAYGVERFAADAAAAGLDGVIATDVPSEEAGPLRTAMRAHDLDVIFLLAPTSTEARIAKVAELASGFVYCVSVTGVTGARGDLPSDLGQFIERVRAHTDLPIAVGFGVSRPEHVAAIGRLCDAAVIGSAIVDVIEQAPADEREARLRGYIESVTGRAAIAS